MSITIRKRVTSDLSSFTWEIEKAHHDAHISHQYLDLTDEEMRELKSLLSKQAV